jgi:hypothetical protein
MARIAGVVSEACVSLAHLVAMIPTVATYRSGGTSCDPLVKPFLIEQSLQFPQL